MYAKMTFYSWRRYTDNLFEKFTKLNNEEEEFFENSAESLSEEKEISEFESKESSFSLFTHSKISSFQPSLNFLVKEDKIYNTPEIYDIID